MGCSSSRLTNDELETAYKLEKERETYNARQEKFEMQCSDIFQDIRRGLDPTNKDLKLDKVAAEIKNRKQVNLSDSELLESLLIYMGQIYIEESSLVQNYEVYDIAFEMIKEMRMFSDNSQTLELAKLLVDNFSRLYAKSQKGTILFFNEKDCNENVFIAVLTNFKFNLSFQLESLNVVFNNFLMKSYNLCQSISEVIESDKKLTTCLVHVFDDEEKHILQEMLLNLNLIFNSIRRNNSIKFLLIQTAKDEIFSLTQEMEKSIIALILKDSLYGLYLGKFGLSDQFMIDLAKNIVNCKNLKFIFIESKSSNINLLDDLVIHGIGRNRSINICIIAGFLISESKANEFKQVQKHNDVLKIFEYIKETF